MKVPQKIQPQVLDFASYTAGLSIEDIKARYGLYQVTKLASNENPLGLSPQVRKVIEKTAGLGFRYPRPGSPDLCRVLADFYGLEPDHFLVGNGSDEVIDLLLRVLVRPGKDHILVCDPSFSMYTLQARLCGLEVRAVPRAEDFSLPVEQILTTTNADTGLVFLTNPDNPTGHTAAKKAILELASRLPPECFLVLDEAYVEFAEDLEAVSPLQDLKQTPNLIILRTFSKLYGLAGLRVGYGIMSPGIRDYLLRVKPPFSVNILAEHAAIAALMDQDFVNKTLETVHAGKTYLTRELTRLGCTVFPSHANFLMFQPPGSAQALFEALLQQGIILRPLSSYGLEDCLRVSIGTMPENQALIQAMERV
ncbi:MAG: histidinol-phosphate transaminase [Desulfohalobiaceae bacterium]|nr:histidinol-phosphate transaminase [Desulfohalobiaceae bacterium]